MRVKSRSKTPPGQPSRPLTKFSYAGTYSHLSHVKLNKKLTRPVTRAESFVSILHATRNMADATLTYGVQRNVAESPLSTAATPSAQTHMHMELSRRCMQLSATCRAQHTTSSAGKANKQSHAVTGTPVTPIDHQHATCARGKWLLRVPSPSSVPGAFPDARSAHMRSGVTRCS